MDDLNAPEHRDSEDHLHLPTYAEHAYLTYAMSVVRSRSLAQVEDGLKPVQRRILYSMHELGLTASSKHIKSARVVGDVIGKLHPHGDSSVYDAMVRTAQDFTLRYPLIDGQGNFGSRDGDGPAAMRYTEVRLTKFATLLLSEIDKGTVDFAPNYDGAFKEPVLLPARLPFLLLNGSKGPAVGFAPENPPHNLREVASAAVAVIRNPQITDDEMLDILPGPDFPGGGQIISPRATIAQAYATGRGSLRMRARWRREDLARGQYRIVVYELPAGVSAASVLAEIEAASNPQVKAGKKELSQDQKNTKATLLSVLESARDESHKDEPVRIVFEPKTSKTDEADLMAVLLAHTGLESSTPINMVMIGLDGAPNQKGVIEQLREWTTSRIATVERRTRFRLDRIAERLHILEGRMVAFVHIDAVIKVIREADEPKASLIARFALSESQADDILEIRLRQLARLEGIKLQREIDELRTEQSTLQVLIDNRDKLVDRVVDEIEADARDFGDDRRTVIEPAEAIAQSDAPLIDEPVTVIISANGWVRARAGHGVDRSAVGYKPGDSEAHVLETRTAHPVCLLDHTGRAYSFKAAEAPTGRGDGVPLTTLVDLQPGARVLHAMSADPATRYVFANSSGHGFVTGLDTLVARKRAGKAFMTLADTELPLRPAQISREEGDAWVACSSEGKDPRILMFPLNEVKVMPGGKGVVLMDVAEKSALATVSVCAGAAITISNGTKSETLAGEGLRKFKLHRARKGCQTPLKNATIVSTEQ